MARHQAVGKYYTDIRRVLEFYCQQHYILHPQFDESYWGPQDKDPLHKIFHNQEFGIRAVVPWAFRYKSGWELGLYVWDKYKIKESNTKMQAPLKALADCNYVYYSLYLNLAAWMAGGNIHRLLIMWNGLEDWKKGPEFDKINYHPDLAEVIIRHWHRNRQPGENGMINMNVQGQYGLY